jgi:hypothetical protein
VKVFGSVTLSEGSDVKNLTVDHGNTYPNNPNEGELFYHSSNGLSVYTGSQWIAVIQSQNQINLTGDVTGSGNGTVNTSLSNITDNGAGSFKKITVNNKGLVIGTTPVIQSDITNLLGNGSISNAMLANSAVANLSGINTGDETVSSIKSKLGITTLSGVNTGDQTIVLSGDVSGSGTGNINVALSNTGVTAGTYTSVTVDAKGRITAGTNSAPTIINSLGYTPLNKAGDNILGSLKFPSASGFGIFPGNTYGWRDLLGDISGKSSGSQAPSQSTFMTGIRGWAYAAGDMGDLTFHLPHDYAPGTDLFLHFHWSHNGTNITGSFVATCNITYAKGHQQSSFSNVISPVLTVPSLNIANTPRYFHRVDEMQISVNGGGVNLLDSSQFEVDGVLIVSFTMSTIPSISGGSPNSPFILSADLHYQSTGISTKNKSPNFYN